jgi:hypothetical protein
MRFTIRMNKFDEDFQDENEITNLNKFPFIKILSFSISTSIILIALIYAVFSFKSLI